MTNKSRSKVLVVVARSFEKKGDKQLEASSTRSSSTKGQEMTPCPIPDPSHSGSTLPDADAVPSGDAISQPAATYPSAQEESGGNILKCIGTDDQITNKPSSSFIIQLIPHLEHGTRKIIPMTWEGIRVSRPNDPSLQGFSAGTLLAYIIIVLELCVVY